MTAPREQLDIAVLQREAERLQSVEAAWASLDPEERVAFRAEWHDLMDIFGHLVESYDGRQLNANDVVALRGVAITLLNALPLLGQLRLRIPPRAALDRIVAARVA